MKICNSFRFRTILANVFILMACAIVPSVVSAMEMTVTEGSLTMNLHRDVLASLNYGTASDPGLYLEEFFEPNAAGVPAAQRGQYHIVPGVGEIPATNLYYPVNGPVVTNLPGNHNQPTNFVFDSTDVTGTATGGVGLAGLMRFRGIWASPNYASSYFAMGEFALKYIPANAINGASGWVLQNHVSFESNTFDLVNVTTTVTDDSFLLSGDFRFTPRAINSFYSPEDAGKILGSVSFQSTITPVPLPASIWLFGSALGGLSLLNRRKHKN